MGALAGGLAQSLLAWHAGAEAAKRPRTELQERPANGAGTPAAAPADKPPALPAFLQAGNVAAVYGAYGNGAAAEPEPKAPM